MKKKLISITLVLVLALGIFAIPAFAAATLSLNKTNYAAGETISATVSGITEQMIKDYAFVSVYNAGAGHGEWNEYKYPQSETDTLTFTAPSTNGSYEMRLYRADPGGRNAPAFEAVFVMSVPFTVGGAATTTPPSTTNPPAQQTSFNAHDWAIPELETAQSYGLIPDVLRNADLTQPITRAEFAAVAVKAYENFTGTTVSPVSSNPFTDTSNADVLKAYNINLVNGTSATTYNPNGQLTRQDAATMMTRVEKKAYIPGWTLATDGNYTLNFTQPSRFSDDGSISGYAKDSVYFMTAKGVINGTGNNMFSPGTVATREQAIIIAVRMVENLKGKTLDYTQGGTTTPPPTTPPPSGDSSSGMPQGNSGIVGVWMAMSTRTSGTFAHVIFYEDGTFLFAAPAKGLYNFDREQDKADRQGDNFWGTYTFNGNTGTWKYDAASVVNEITLESDGGLKLTSTYSKFYRCASVDNYRFDGSYTSRADPFDPELSQPGEKAVIRFKSDGTFIDEGLFTNIYTYLGIGTGKTKDDFAPGNGTYELKDFTLILRYSDGRIIQTFFSFFINGKDASDYVCIDSRLLLTQMP